jgi:hypothetical protein
VENQPLAAAPTHADLHALLHLCAQPRLLRLLRSQRLFMLQQLGLQLREIFRECVFLRSLCCHQGLRVVCCHANTLAAQLLSFGFDPPSGRCLGLLGGLCGSCRRCHRLGHCGCEIFLKSRVPLSLRFQSPPRLLYDSLVLLVCSCDCARDGSRYRSFGAPIGGSTFVVVLVA